MNIPDTLQMEIRRRHESGDFPKQIARELKLARSDVLRVIKNNHVPPAQVRDEEERDRAFREEVRRRRRQFQADWEIWRPYVAAGFAQWWERWGRFQRGAA